MIISLVLSNLLVLILRRSMVDKLDSGLKADVVECDLIHEKETILMIAN